MDYEVTVQLLNPPDGNATRLLRHRQDHHRHPQGRDRGADHRAHRARARDVPKSGDSAAIALGREPTKQIGQRDVEGVFIVGADNKVTFRPVRVGIAGEEYFEVVDGLRPGEKIVAGSYQAIRELKDGTTVREAKEEEKPAAGAQT